METTRRVPKSEENEWVKGVVEREWREGEHYDTEPHDQRYFEFV